MSNRHMGEGKGKGKGKGGGGRVCHARLTVAKDITATTIIAMDCKKSVQITESIPPFTV